MAQADRLWDKLEALEKEAREIKKRAENAGRYNVALQGIRELVRIVELQGRLLGQLKDAQTVNVFMMPEWVIVQTAILVALERYPAARHEVVEALNECRG